MTDKDRKRLVANTVDVIDGLASALEKAGGSPRLATRDELDGMSALDFIAHVMAPNGIRFCHKEEEVKAKAEPHPMGRPEKGPAPDGPCPFDVTTVLLSRQVSEPGYVMETFRPAELRVQAGKLIVDRAPWRNDLVCVGGKHLPGVKSVSVTISAEGKPTVQVTRLADLSPLPKY